MEKLTIEEQIAQYNKDICLLHVKEQECIDQAEELTFKVHALAAMSVKKKYEDFLNGLSIYELDQLSQLIVPSHGEESIFSTIYSQTEREHKLFCDKIMEKTNV